MKSRFGIATMVLGFCLTASATVFAAPLHTSAVATRTDGRALYGKEKMVRFSLHNASTAAIKVTAGETEMTLEPGKTMAVKLPVGMQLLAKEASTHYAAGSVLAVVSDTLSDATITLN